MEVIMVYLVFEGTVYFTSASGEVADLNDGYQNYRVVEATDDLHCYLNNMSDWSLIDAPNALYALEYAGKIDKSVNSMCGDIRHRKSADLNNFRSYILFGNRTRIYPKFVADLRSIITTSETKDDFHALELIDTPFVYKWRAT
jgi:hypothetical protein